MLKHTCWGIHRQRDTEKIILSSQPLLYHHHDWDIFFYPSLEACLLHLLIPEYICHLSISLRANHHSCQLHLMSHLVQTIKRCDMSQWTHGSTGDFKSAFPLCVYTVPWRHVSLWLEWLSSILNTVFFLSIINHSILKSEPTTVFKIAVVVTFYIGYLKKKKKMIWMKAS